MHRIDKLELLETLSKVRQETKALLVETAADGDTLRLRRIILLLGYMAEHLEMLREAGPRDGSSAPRFVVTKRAANQTDSAREEKGARRLTNQPTRRMQY